MTAGVTFAVGWVLKRMFEKSVTAAAKEGAKDAADEKVAETTVAPDAPSIATPADAPTPHVSATGGVDSAEM